jgi:hypothetical protein
MNRRWIPAGLVLVALLSPCIAPSVAIPAPVGMSQSAAAVKLRQEMRKLWTDHVVWTRNYIIAAAADGPDAKTAATRLIKNQEDIGGAIGAVYGKAAGDQLTGLLKEHISVAVELIEAAKARDETTQQHTARKWHRNAEQIADFLSKANPNWPRTTLIDMMNKHLSTTTDEVTARFARNWDEDVKAYDAVYEHILAMADVLSDGIVKQFPARFQSAKYASTSDPARFRYAKGASSSERVILAHRA